MDSALANIVVAFISAVLGAAFGHWLSANDERKRQQFIALMEIDKIFRTEAQYLSGGQFAHASRLRADLNTYAVLSGRKSIWDPTLSVIEAIERERDAHGGRLPPPDADLWKGYDRGVRMIGDAIAMAKARAILDYLVPPWYRRPRMTLVVTWGRFKKWAARQWNALRAKTKRQ